MSVLVQGILRFPDNTPIVGASIKFIASKFISSGMPIGASLEILTDNIGAYSQELLEGSYHVFYKQFGNELYTHIVDAHLLEGMGGVVLGAPITLEEIIGTLPGDTPIYTGCDTIPQHSEFTIDSGFTTIMLSWEIDSYICQDVTEIWVSATNDFDSKVLLTTTEARVYSHSLGHDALRYYWIRPRNLNGDYGNWFLATGVTGQTSQDPGMVLADLQQDVYDSTLFATLRNNFSATFVQDTPPEYRLNGDDLLHGDTWVDTSDSNQSYTWDNTLVPEDWVIKVNKETTTILTELSHTQLVADDGSKGFFQPDQPLYTVSKFNDIWIDTSQPTPLTFTAIKRFEDSTSRSTGTLDWRSASDNALGRTYVEAYNTKAIVGGHTVELEEAFTITNALEGQYSLRINANGSIAGFGLSAGSAGCLVNGVLDISIAEVDCTGTDKVWVPAESSFIVAADTFAITGTDATPIIPFVVSPVAEDICYVNGYPDPTIDQATCTDTTATPGGSWIAENTSVVGIQGSLVLDGTMNANAIVAGSITGEHIAGTTITGDHMDANTITANLLVIEGTGAITPNTIGAVAPGDVYSSRLDVAFFVHEDGSITGTEANSYPTGTNTGDDYVTAVKGSLEYIGVNTVQWSADIGEVAPSIVPADYDITRLLGTPGTPGTNFYVQLVSDNGYSFRNNTGAVKTLTANVYINGVLSSNVTHDTYVYQWYNGSNIAYVTSSGDYVSTSPAAGLYPADGTDATNGLNLRSIKVDSSDVSFTDTLNLQCVVTDNN